jgi:SPX domain protein involved in polyphosphate accumulation
MRFASTLKRSVYPPWSGQYIDYDKLKDLLRESSAPASPVDADDEDQWTERDESAFVDELVNVQLEKVHRFQTTTFERLRNETAAVESLLEPLGAKAMEQNSSNRKETPEEERQKVLKEALASLNKITKELNELEKYSRINYTGFLKAAKKHDRKRGRSYRVLPLLRVRLSALPFNTEDYSPLLYRLTAMFSFVRQSMSTKDRKVTFETAQPGADTYTAYKCASTSVSNVPADHAKSGCIPRTCSKSRQSFCAACRFWCTTPRRPRSSMAANQTRRSRRFTSTTKNSASMGRRLMATVTCRPSGCVGTGLSLTSHA